MSLVHVHVHVHVLSITHHVVIDLWIALPCISCAQFIP